MALKQKPPAKKKPAPVELDKVDPKKLKPGEKQELAIQLDQFEDRKQKVEREIHALKVKLAHSKQMQTWETTAQVEGLLANLKKLHTAIQKQIKELNDQLKQIPDLNEHEQKLIDLINKNCGEYIQAVQKSKSWLYRGAGGPNQYLARSWESRRPKDSDREAQVMFDRMLIKLGFKALRSNSIFATSDVWHASQFGSQVYVILPLDKHSAYTYTSHDDITLESIEDVAWDYTKWRKYLDTLKNHLGSDKLNKTLSKTDANSLEKFISNIEDNDYDASKVFNLIQKHVKSGNKFKIPATLTNVKLEDFFNEQIFVKNFKPKQTDLTVAMKNGFEVMIYGAYLALEVSEYADLLGKAYKVYPQV